MIGGPGKTESEGQKVLGPSMIFADRRLQCEHYDQLIRAMSMEDSSSLFNYMRMDPIIIGPRIQKSDTNFKRALEQGMEMAKMPRA